MRTSCVTEFRKKTTGSITVEFVAMLPVLLGALGFSYEFGRAMWAYDVMTRDVRASVRYLSRLPRPPSVTYPPFDNSAKTNAINVAKTGVPSGGTTHFPWGAPWSTCNPCVTVGAETNFAIGNYNENGFVFSVTGAVPLSLYFLGFLDGFGFNTSYTLTVTDRARYIGN
jgi:Flp pilus assembly protein TadG